MHDNMNGLDLEPSSMEHIKRSDGFPKKALVSEDDTLKVPFPLLSGESAEFLGRTADGIVVLSNFRLLIRYKDSFINVPLGLIESVEIRDIFYLIVYCKDATVVRCAFPANDTCQDWFKRLAEKTAPCRKLEDVFAFAFHAWSADRIRDSDSSMDSSNQMFPFDTCNTYSFTKEIERMGFDLKKAWRYTDINKDFGLCSGYPSEHIIPKSVSDDNLRKVAGFRALKRFPSVVWRNKRNGAVLVRSSQPEMGFFGWRNEEDENLLNAIPIACSLNAGFNSASEKTKDTGEEEDKNSPKKMLIMDCRSYSAASANRLKGGGVECSEYYQSCEVQFMNLPNIHTIRKNFVSFRILCSSNSDQASWLSTLEKTNWLHNISSLLRASMLAVSSIEKEGKPVLVHCSDGWDRTPQIISLSELMLDPFYRTREGFQTVVEREWLQYGHKFGDRCGNGVLNEDLNERCPVFLQWLDCVYQLLSQFPCEFEFNEAFLIKLVHHTYSNLFGTFLCNTVQMRIKMKLPEMTASVWGALKCDKFINHLFAPSQEHEVLYPLTHVQNVLLWKSVYLSNNSSVAGPEDACPTYQTSTVPESETMGLQKTRSCENILNLADELTSSLSRRKSDPNIATDHGEQQAQKLLTHAIDGDTSCSSESVKSSDNNVSVSESGDTITEAQSDIDNSSRTEQKTEQDSVNKTDIPENGVNDKNTGEDEKEASDTNDEQSTQDSLDIETVNQNGMENGTSNGLENGTSNGLENGTSNGLENGTSNGLVNGTSNGLENGASKGLENGTSNGMENGTSNDEGEIDTQPNVETDRDGENGHNETEKDNRLTESEKNGHTLNGFVEDGLKPDSVNFNGNGIHEMNGHSDGIRENFDDSNESSENSIETISENEDSVSDRKISENGESFGENGFGPVLDSDTAKLCNSNEKQTQADTINIAAMKIKQRAICAVKSEQHLHELESSTDTVTEDQQNGDVVDPAPTQNGCHTVRKVESLNSLCDKAALSLQSKYREHTNSISTSTSDLTDPHVLDLVHSKSSHLSTDGLLNGADKSHQASLKLCCLLAQSGLNANNGAGVSPGTSTTPPLFPTPVSPQSQYSTCPPTPGTSCSDRRSLDSTVPRHQTGVSRYLDADGLTTFTDPVQQKIRSIKSSFEQQLSAMREENSHLRLLLAQHASTCNGEGLCNPDYKIDLGSPGSCDMHSIQSTYSNPASDASWDQMDDPEINVTRWVPDHLVTNCAGCDMAFSMIKRKHHCRNCGLIFCHTCCKDTVPLPHQMIHTNERVCQSCYNKVTLSLTNSIIEMDNGIGEQNTLAAAASH